MTGTWKRWTEPEKQIIREVFPVHGAVGCVKRMEGRRTLQAVQTKAKEMFVKTISRSSVKSCRSWSPEEDAVIARVYPSMGPKGCMPLLPGRGRCAIRHRARIMGVVYVKPTKPAPGPKPRSIREEAFDAWGEEPMRQAIVPQSQWKRIDAQSLPPRSVFDLAQTMEMEAA